jgi:hypothetical protein
MTLLTLLQRSLVFLPHGKYIGRWADAGIRAKVAELLEEVHVRFDIEIDISRLEERLKSNEELKHVDCTIKRRTPEEMKALQNIRSLVSKGYAARKGESEESRAKRHEIFLKSKRELYAQQDDESDGAFAKRDKERKAKANQGNAKKRARQPDETDEAFKKRTAKRKAKENKKTKAFKERQPGENDEDMAQRIAAKKAKKSKSSAIRYTAKAAERKQRQQRQPGETEEDWETRLAKEKADKNEKARVNRNKRKAKKNLAGGQQMLSGFLQPAS